MRLLPSIVALGLLAAAPAARAQSAEAEALFEDANKLMDQGKLAEACKAFEASNRIEPRAGTLIRLGECREQNHQLASAWSAYKDALIRVKDAKKRDIATAKVAQLEPKLSRLTVTVSSANQVAGLEVTRGGRVLESAEWNRAVPVDGGSYAIEAHAPGYRAWKGSAKVPEQSGVVTIDVPKLVEEPHSVVVTTTAVPTPSTDQPVEHERSMWTTRRKLAAGSATLAVLAAGGGIALGVIANGKQHDADTLCMQHVCASQDDALAASHDLATAQARALDANIAFGVAGAAAIVAGVLWFTGAPEHTGVAVAPIAAPGTSGIAVSGRW